MRVILFVTLLHLYDCNNDFKPRAVNLALETVLEFDNNDNSADMQIIDKVKGFLDRIKFVIDSRRNTRRSLSGNEIKFSDFAKNVMIILTQYDDKDLEDILAVIDEEFRKYHYKGCRFHELIENNNVRRFMTEKLNHLANAPAKKVKNFMNGALRTIQENKLDAKQKLVVDYVNSLYLEDAEPKFRRLLQNLALYTVKSKRSNLSLVKIVRDGIRSIVFDHYSALDSNTRKSLRMKLETFWQNFNGLEQDHYIWKFKPLSQVKDKSKQILREDISSDSLELKVTSMKKLKKSKVRHHKTAGKEYRKGSKLINGKSKVKNIARTNLKPKHAEELLMIDADTEIFGKETDDAETKKMKRNHKTTKRKKLTFITLYPEAITLLDEKKAKTSQAPWKKSHYKKSVLDISRKQQELNKRNSKKKKPKKVENDEMYQMMVEQEQMRQLVAREDQMRKLAEEQRNNKKVQEIEEIVKEEFREPVKEENKEDEYKTKKVKHVPKKQKREKKKNAAKKNNFKGLALDGQDLYMEKDARDIDNEKIEKKNIKSKDIEETIDEEDDNEENLDTEVSKSTEHEKIKKVTKNVKDDVFVAEINVESKDFTALSRIRDVMTTAKMMLRNSELVKRIKQQMKEAEIANKKAEEALTSSEEASIYHRTLTKNPMKRVKDKLSKAKVSMKITEDSRGWDELSKKNHHEFKSPKQFKAINPYERSEIEDSFEHHSKRYRKFLKESPDHDSDEGIPIEHGILPNIRKSYSNITTEATTALFTSNADVVERLNNIEEALKSVREIVKPKFVEIPTYGKLKFWEGTPKKDIQTTTKTEAKSTKTSKMTRKTTKLTTKTTKTTTTKTTTTRTPKSTTTVTTTERSDVTFSPVFRSVNLSNESTDRTTKKSFEEKLSALLTSKRNNAEILSQKSSEETELKKNFEETTTPEVYKNKTHNHTEGIQMLDVNNNKKGGIDILDVNHNNKGGIHMLDVNNNNNKGDIDMLDINNNKKGGNNIMLDVNDDNAGGIQMLDVNNDITGGIHMLDVKNNNKGGINMLDVNNDNKSGIHMLDVNKDKHENYSEPYHSSDINSDVYNNSGQIDDFFKDANKDINMTAHVNELEEYLNTTNADPNDKEYRIKRKMYEDLKSVLSANEDSAKNSSKDSEKGSLRASDPLNLMDDTEAL